MENLRGNLGNKHSSLISAHLNIFLKIRMPLGAYESKHSKPKDKLLKRHTHKMKEP